MRPFLLLLLLAACAPSLDDDDSANDDDAADDDDAANDDDAADDDDAANDDDAADDDDATEDDDDAVEDGDFDALDVAALCAAGETFSTEGTLTVQVTPWTDLSPLSCVTGAGGLHVLNNPLLTSLSTGGAQEPGWGWWAGIVLEGNPALTDIDVLNNLMKMKGSIRIIDNDALVGLPAMPNLTWLGGYLTFEGNAALTSLDGMDQLWAVQEDVRIVDNAALSDVAALHGIDEISFGSLVITGNPSLSAADAQALADAIGSIDNGTTISNNGP